jgi:SAM-dependent methyltransferase
MIRWFKDLAETREVWGVDIAAELVVWCQQNLSPPFRFATTTSFPHLPFEDRYFDLIYASSVFTHIADLADAWLLELKRLLRPGGRLFATIMEKGTWKEEDMHRLFGPHITSEILSLAKLDFAMFTVSRKPAHAQVFYDLDYLRKHWGRFLNVLSVAPGFMGHRQTAVLLEKQS